MGAIVNSGSAQTQGLANVTLTADATIGGANRWDIRNSGSGRQPLHRRRLQPRQDRSQSDFRRRAQPSPACKNININAGELSL